MADDASKPGSAAPPPATATVTLPPADVKPSIDEAHPDPAAPGYDPGASTVTPPTPTVVLGGPGGLQFRNYLLELPQETHARLNAAPPPVVPRPRVPSEAVPPPAETPAETPRALPAPETA